MKHANDENNKQSLRLEKAFRVKKVLISRENRAL